MNNFIHNGKIVSPDDEVLTQAILQECYQKGLDLFALVCHKKTLKCISLKLAKTLF